VFSLRLRRDDAEHRGVASDPLTRLPRVVTAS
jgi:hypothetical protein